MSFDRLAPHYRGMERILAGGKLHRCRTAFLAEIPVPRRILLLGEGHGRGLVECRRSFPSASITCLDRSAAMLEVAGRQLVKESLGDTTVEYVCADIMKWRPAGDAYDLVVTNFFLDCFRTEQLEEIIHAVTSGTAEKANWLVADFQVPTGGLRQVRARAILWLMYRFFRVATQLPAKRLANPNPILQRAGFQLQQHQEFDWGLLRSDWWRREVASDQRAVERDVIHDWVLPRVRASLPSALR